MEMLWASPWRRRERRVWRGGRMSKVWDGGRVEEAVKEAKGGVVAIGIVIFKEGSQKPGVVWKKKWLIDVPIYQQVKCLASECVPLPL